MSITPLRMSRAIGEAGVEVANACGAVIRSGSVEDALPQEIEVLPAIHLPFESLPVIDLALTLPVTQVGQEHLIYCLPITPETGRKTPKFRKLALLDVASQQFRAGWSRSRTNRPNSWASGCALATSRQRRISSSR